MENSVPMAAQGFLLDSLLRALAKQPGIDSAKLAADISASLVWKQVAGENKPAMETVVQTARALAHAALPGVPVR